MQKVVEAFQGNHVRISCAFEAQDDEANVLVACALFELIETTIQFRRRTKEQFTFQIVKQHCRARRVVWQALANDALAADHEFRPAQKSGARNEQENRQSHADQNRELDADKDR